MTATPTPSTTLEPEDDPNRSHLPTRWSAKRIHDATTARTEPDLHGWPAPSDDYAPCHMCGVAVHRGQSTAPLVTITVEAAPDPLNRARPARKVPLGRCAVCARRDTLGARLTGDADTGGRVVALATVLGMTLPAASDRRRLETMATVATSGLTYADRLGDLEGHQLLGKVARVPFGHLTTTDLNTARTAMAEVMTRRLARSTVDAMTNEALTVGPPPLNLSTHEDQRLAIRDGCAVCGVAAVSVPPAAMVAAMVEARTPADPSAALPEAARAVWSRLSVRPSNLGASAPRNADHHVKLAGHTCPACTAVVAPSRWPASRDHKTEPWTSRTVGRALAAFLGVPGAGVGGGPLIDVATFASVVVSARRRSQPDTVADLDPAPDPAPSSTPWGHVDLADARRRLRLPDPNDPDGPTVHRRRGGAALSVTPTAGQW